VIGESRFALEVWPIGLGAEERMVDTKIVIENQSFVSSGEGVFIPAFSFPGFDSIPGVILAKHQPKFPTAPRALLAKPLLKQDR
jgi:hypothetical protein